MTVAGAGLHLRRLGGGPPLLFLHGPLGVDDDDALLARLAERFGVVAPDHPGFGRSADLEHVDTIADLAFFYADLLDELDLRDVHLVGHALGGWAALELAIRDASRLRSLTLIDSAGIRVDGVRRGDMFIATPPELGALLFADPALQRRVAEQQEDPERQEILAKNRVGAAKLTWHPRLYDPRLARWLHRVRVPTLLLWGAEDRVIPPAHGEALRDLIPGARLELLPGCGHMATVERPDAVAGAIAAFTRGLG